MHYYWNHFRKDQTDSLHLIITENKSFFVKIWLKIQMKRYLQAHQQRLFIKRQKHSLVSYVKGFALVHVDYIVYEQL